MQLHKELIWSYSVGLRRDLSLPSLTVDFHHSLLCISPPLLTFSPPPHPFFAPFTLVPQTFCSYWAENPVIADNHLPAQMSISPALIPSPLICPPVHQLVKLDSQKCFCCLVLWENFIICLELTRCTQSCSKAPYTNVNAGLLRWWMNPII